MSDGRSTHCRVAFCNNPALYDKYLKCNNIPCYKTWPTIKVFVNTSCLKHLQIFSFYYSLRSSNCLYCFDQEHVIHYKIPCTNSFLNPKQTQV